MFHVLCGIVLLLMGLGFWLDAFRQIDLSDKILLGTFGLAFFVFGVVVGLKLI